MLERIISGGQTGVDRGAIGAALELGFPYGGWVPDGRLAEKGGVVPACFEDMQEGGDYRQRTSKNVGDADATLILTPGPPTGGTHYTYEVAAQMGTRFLVVDVQRGLSVQTANSLARALFLSVVMDQVLLWLSMNPIQVLNVAGPRESKAPGIERLTFDLMSWVIQGVRNG